MFSEQLDCEGVHSNHANSQYTILYCDNLSLPLADCVVYIS